MGEKVQSGPVAVKALESSISNHTPSSGGAAGVRVQSSSQPSPSPGPGTPSPHTGAGSHTPASHTRPSAQVSPWSQGQPSCPLGQISPVPEEDPALVPVAAVSEVFGLELPSSPVLAVAGAVEVGSSVVGGRVVSPLLAPAVALASLAEAEAAVRPVPGRSPSRRG